MEDYLRRAAIWPGAPVIDDPGGLPVTPEGKMEERKRKYAAALHSVVQ